MTSPAAAMDPRAPIAKRTGDMPEPRPIQSSAQPAPSPAEIRRDHLMAIDLNAMTEKWDVLVGRIRATGKALMATALEHATPTAVTARGDVTITLDEPNDIYARAIQNGSSEVLGVLREWFTPIDRVQIAGVGQPPASPPKRLTDEMVRAQKLEVLKKKDPALAAAIEELDLEVID
jgi:hypothetical protein